jgi:hypothetical protein
VTRAARIGAGLAGSVLCAIPPLDLLMQAGPVGPIHLVVGIFGLALVWAALAPAAGEET